MTDRGTGTDGGGGDPGPAVARIRVALPTHLSALAGVEAETVVEVPRPGPLTARALLDALEARYPSLRGTIRDHDSGNRRPYMRYFAGKADLSHASPDAPLPERVATGDEVFRVLGAIAGG